MGRLAGWGGFGWKSGVEWAAGSRCCRSQLPSSGGASRAQKKSTRRGGGSMQRAGRRAKYMQPVGVKFL